MLHAAEKWAMTVATLNRLRRNDRAMIRWICNVKANDKVKPRLHLPRSSYDFSVCDFLYDF